MVPHLPLSAWLLALSNGSRLPHTGVRILCPTTVRATSQTCIGHLVLVHLSTQFLVNASAPGDAVKFNILLAVCDADLSKPLRVR